MKFKQLNFSILWVKRYRKCITLNIEKLDTVEILLNVIEDYCSPKKIEAIRFNNFFTRNQQFNDTFDSFITSLKS